MLDYIVVGLGLSGLSLCAQLEEQDKSFMVIADDRGMASTVAGGVYNPVVLKRLTATWRGAAFLDFALPFYKKLEKELGTHVLHEQPVLRRIASAEEQNNWFTATDQPTLNRFLSSKIRANKNNAITAPLGFGEVQETGRVDVPLMLKVYADHLEKKGWILREALDTEALNIQKEEVRYKNHTAKRMILAMGYRALENPWFNYLPIRGNKGEVLVIEAPELKLDTILKAADFVIPLGNHRYKVGATYDRTDLSLEPTEASRSQLIRNLEGLINCSYSILQHEVGIRPTVPDRRPLVGTHPEFLNLAILNGMGSRAVLMAPRLAYELIQHMETDSSLDPEINIDRYRQFYEEG